MRKPTQIELCNCFATRQAARRLTRMYERHLAEAGLTSAQFSILVSVNETGEVAMSVLADALAMDRTTLVRAIRPLQRGGLMRQRPSTEDARRLLLSLTSTGERLLEKAVTLWSNAQREFEGRVGSAEATRLRRDLFALSRMN